MKSNTSLVLAVALIAAAPGRSKADLSLGSAANFAVLAGSTVTNSGPSVIVGGDVGVAPGTSITGFGPGTLEAPYTFHSNDSVATLAQADLLTAYNAATLLTPTETLTGQDLGGLTLTPGVYTFATAAALNGILTLDDQGDANARFVFQIGSTLTTGSGASIRTINGGADPGSSVFWQIGSSATLGTDTDFEGHILAYASITMNVGSNIENGSALALNGAVTLDSNHIVNSLPPSAVPEPATISLVLIGGSLVGLRAFGKRLFRARRR